MTKKPAVKRSRGWLGKLRPSGGDAALEHLEADLQHREKERREAPLPVGLLPRLEEDAVVPEPLEQLVRRVVAVAREDRDPRVLVVLVVDLVLGPRRDDVRRKELERVRER